MSKKSLPILMVLAAAILFVACNKDRTAPDISIIRPADNAIAMGHILIQARASDDRSTPIVEFYVDNNYVGVDSLGSEDSTYSCVWDASGEAMGTQHTIKAKAIDAAANVKESETVTITIGVPTGPTSHSGSVQYPETWSPLGNPHIVNGNLTFNAMVTMLPGVEVKVDPVFSVKVGGSGGLRAQGTSSSGILFTSNAESPAPGDWQGIEILAGAMDDSVVMEYCTIEYGGKDTLHANLTCRSKGISMSHCTIQKGVGYGVWTSGNNLGVFANNTVREHQRYAMHVDARYAEAIGGTNDLSGNARGIEVEGALINANTTWHDPNAPFVLTNNLVIGNLLPGATLSLDAGVTIRVRPGLGISAGLDSSTFGGLIADGAPGQPVTFTSDSSQPHAGDWDGITFGRLTLPGQANLDYALIEYGGGNGLASVYCDSFPAQITNSFIRYSSSFGVMTSQIGFGTFTGNDISLCQLWPVSVEPDYVASVGANHLAPGLYIQPGIVNQSASWLYNGFPYIIGGAVEIGAPAHPVLRLGSGDTIFFTDDAVLRTGSVYADSGAFNADGAALLGWSQARGAWKGLEFRELTVSDSSWLTNSIVKFGGGDTFGDILCLHAAPLIRSNEIASSSSWGIYLYNSPLVADTVQFYNTFHDNTLGDVGP